MKLPETAAKPAPRDPCTKCQVSRSGSEKRRNPLQDLPSLLPMRDMATVIENGQISRPAHPSSYVARKLHCAKVIPVTMNRQDRALNTRQQCVQAP